MICKACGTPHTSALPGSGVMEATLWVLIPCWPAAVIYSIWRRTGRRKCQACSSTRQAVPSCQRYGLECGALVLHREL